MDLGVIITAVFAILGIAERLVLKTDLALCRDGERFDLRACFLKARDRILGYQMLAVLRRDIDDPLALAIASFSTG